MNTVATKEWESFGSKELVFSQHLLALDKAQENLARMIALQETGMNQERMLVQTEFITFFIKTIFKSRIKINKYNKEEDINLSKQLDTILARLLKTGIEDDMFPAFVNILYKVGLLYDKLGYNSAERLKVRTPMQSDLQIEGMEQAEYVEPMVSGYDDI